MLHTVPTQRQGLSVLPIRPLEPPSAGTARTSQATCSLQHGEPALMAGQALRVPLPTNGYSSA
eukprot:7457589-Karenia_brevis.AAC.1